MICFCSPEDLVQNNEQCETTGVSHRGKGTNTDTDAPPAIEVLLFSTHVINVQLLELQRHQMNSN
jgi:hypothetical protein